MSTPHLALRQLRAFCLVAQEQSMTRASQKLFLTPSALSMLVRGLEEELGLRLFQRTTRKVLLTDAGAEFLPSAQKTLEALDSAVLQLQAGHLKQGEQIRIATSPLLASSLMPPLMAAFKQDFPGVRLDLLDVPVALVADMVKTGQADVGICTSAPDQHELKTEPIFQDTLCVLCPQAHPLAAIDKVDWADLIDVPLILLRTGTGLRDLIEKPLQRWASQLRIEHEVSNINTALGLICAGLGISILPAYILAQTGVQGVVARPLRNPQVTREVVALIDPARPLSDTAQTFLHRFRKLTAQTLVSS